MRWTATALAALFWILPRSGSGAEPEVLRGPYLQALLDRSVEILWATHEPGRGAVRYWRDPGTVAIARESTPDVEHHVGISGLSPGTTYHYEVLDGDRVIAGPHRFRTSPGPEGTARVAVIGDSGSRNEDQRAIAAVIRELAPDLMLHTGDMVYVGNLDTTVFEPYREIFWSSCFYPAWGNHDLLFVLAGLFLPPGENSEGLTTYYSFDWGSAHFVALDTNWSFDAETRQIEWLIADLEKARDSPTPWTILFFHEPVFTVGSYAWSQLRPRAVIPRIADEFKVDLVLTGHDHNYQRSHPIRDGVALDAWQDPDFVSPRGTIYIVTGGGGGILYPSLGGRDGPRMRLFDAVHHVVELEISPRELSVRALDREKQIVDAFTIRKGTPAPPFRFVRGDANVDGEVDLTDAVAILSHLFLGRRLECSIGADLKGNGGALGIADPIYLLNFLFLGGPPPAPPFPECGAEPGVSDAWCTRTSCP